MQDKLWKLTATGAAVVAAIVARNALTKGWKAVVHTDPPRNPADPTTDVTEALAWSAATGAAVGVARMAARRAAAGAWASRTGQLPHELVTAG